MDQQEFHNKMLQQLRDYGETFTDPKADWDDALVLWNGKQIVGVDLRMPDDPEVKAMMLIFTIPVSLIMNQAIFATVVTSNWMVAIDMEQIGPNPRPRNHPDRYEALIVRTFDREGHAITSRSVIQRWEIESGEDEGSGPSPTLGPWIHQAPDETYAVDVIGETVRDVMVYLKGGEASSSK